MKTLFIIPWLPYPLNHGGAQAFFNMVNEIRRHHEVTLLLNAWNAEEEKNIRELQTVWPDVEIRFYDYRKDSETALSFEDELDALNMNALTKWQCTVMHKGQESLRRKISRRMNRARIKAIDSGEQMPEDMATVARSRSTLYNRYSGLTDGFLKWIYNEARRGFDLIQVEFYEYLPLIHILPKDVETVFLHHEIRFVHNENELTVFAEETPQDRLLLEEEKEKEIADLRKYDHIIVLTDTDKDILHGLMPDKDIYVSPAITEAAKKLDNAMAFKPGEDMIFMGNSDHMPNMDGLMWFCSEVMPIITEKHPQATLYVTGRWDAQSQLTVSAMCKSVRFTGFVDDITAFLNGKISVVPIRVGSGMRMKIIDTVAATAPLVTTSKGCEGLPFANGVDAMIEDEPQALAQAVCRLIDDPELQRRIAENAHAKTASSLNADSLLSRRLHFYTSLKA